MNRYLKTDVENLVRDRVSSAVLNTDKDAFSLYKKQRSRILQADRVQEEVDSLKQEMVDIKIMLQSMIEKK